MEAEEVIEKGQNLIEEVREMMKNRTYDFDLTAKMELKSTCKEIERYVKLVSGKKAKEKHLRHLEQLIVHLETIIRGLTAYYDRG